MTNKKLIKQEIERLFDEYPMSRGMLKHLTIFIDSLPEEFASVEENDCTTCINDKGCVTCENEELYESAMRNDKYSCISEEPASEDLKKEISKWRNHYISVLENNLRIDLRDIEVTANHFAEWQRKKDVEEMMKTLVGGEIVKDIHNQLSVKSEPLNDTFGKFGDKVKIIIVKEN